METFYKITKVRSRIYIMVLIIVLAILSFSSIETNKFQAVGGYFSTESSNPSMLLGPISYDNTGQFKSVFRIGLLCFMFILLLKNIIRDLMALKDPLKLEILKIKELDERSIFIKHQSNNLGFDISMLGIATATYITAEINIMVFGTLLSVFIFLFLVRTCLKAYYSLKY